MLKTKFLCSTTTLIITSLFFPFHISKLVGTILIYAVYAIAFSIPAIADKSSDLKSQIIKRGLSSEDINRAMQDRFPDSDFPYYATVNGCSTPALLGLIVISSNRWFKPACNNHDRCYTTLGQVKKVCDNRLLIETSKICESINNLECSATASAYYKAVDRSSEAQKAYDTAQKQQREYVDSVYAWLNERVFYTNHFITTGILVNSGEKLKIRASGIIDFGRFTPSGGPNGIMGYQSYNYFVDVPHGNLMARFRRAGMGDWDGWFPIGESWDRSTEKTISLTESGILEFLVNDNKPTDNIGKFKIEVISTPIAN